MDSGFIVIFLFFLFLFLGLFLSTMLIEDFLDREALLVLALYMISK